MTKTKNEKTKIRLTKNYLWLGAIASGLLCSIAYSFEPLNFLIFFSIIPFMYTLFRFNKHSLKTKTAVFLFSMCYHVPTLLWLYTLCPIPNTSLPMFVSVLIMTAGILAASAVESFMMVIAFLPYNRLRHTNIPLPLIFSVLYILGELLQEIIGDLAFPWMRLGSVLSSFTAFIQSASLFGTLFISLIILLINSVLTVAIMRIIKKRHIKKTILLILLAVGIFMVNFTYGSIRLSVKEQFEKKDTSVAVIQANYGSVTKWNTPASEIVDKHIELSQKAIEEAHPSIIVWSETAVGDFLSSSLTQKVCDFAKENNVMVVTGIFDSDSKYEYNAMTAFKPDGLFTPPYYKQKLVPMGEYVPFYKYINKLVKSDKKFLIPAKGADILATESTDIGCIICYESIFPNLVRNTVNSGAQILTMASNDSWFGTTPALEQHLGHAQLRAVENGRYLLRAGNTGISAIISSYGEVESRLEVNTEGYLTAQVEQTSEKTLYTIIGDVIILPSIVLFAYGIWLMFLNREKNKKLRRKKAVTAAVKAAVKDEVKREHHGKHHHKHHEHNSDNTQQ